PELRIAADRRRGALFAAHSPHTRNPGGFDRGVVVATVRSGRFYRGGNSGSAAAPTLDGRSAIRPAGASFGARMGRKEKPGINRGDDRDRVENGAGRDERGGPEADQSFAERNALRSQSLRALFAVPQSGGVRVGPNNRRRAGSEGRGGIRARDGVAR